MILFPNAPGATFDYDYYTKTHNKMYTGALGDVLISQQVFKGVAGVGGDAPYLTMNLTEVTSAEAFMAAAGPHLAELVADVPNFTTVQPIIQIQERIHEQ